MIDIILDEDQKLRDIQQIAKPESNNKIYIEEKVYKILHYDSGRKKMVFVLMGYTQKTQDNYATFIDGIIPVYDMEFDGSLPIWNNRVWNEAFRQIKKDYNNSIIVGWAMDQKGFSPKITDELESIHREQFKGIHQLLLLMDSMESDEFFYQMRNNHFIQRGGFYIYHDDRIHIPIQEEAGGNEEVKASVEEKLPKEEEIEEKLHYRQLVEETKKSDNNQLSGIAVAAAILLLVGIVGAGIVQNRIRIPGLEQMIETFFDTSNENINETEIILLEENGT